MSESVIVALISVIGTFGGSLLGIITSAKLTNYRIAQLEKKVDKHNNFAERVPLCEKDIRHIYHEIDEVKGVRK